MSPPGPIDQLGPAIIAHLDTLRERCFFPSPPARIDCAVSGGADSMALLVLAVASGCQVCVHHVDHGLRDGSATEASAVEAAAQRFGAAFAAHSVALDVGPNQEARARAARYGVLPAEVATGHTADDQAETMLLALIRGSAWQGMGAMTPSPRHPILGLRGHETRTVCDLVGLDVVEDPSNADTTHRRNRIRHELLPLLEDIAERDLVPVLERQAELFRQGGDILDDASAAIDVTDAKALAAAPEVLARLAIRNWLWLERSCDHPPDLRTVDRVLDVARLGSVATDVGLGWRVERSEQRLRLVAPPGDTSATGPTRE